MLKVEKNLYTNHYSVLKKECIEHLTRGKNFDQPILFADLTFGAGGHSFLLLNHHPNIQVYSCDQDPDALANGYKKIQEQKMDGRIRLFDTNFVHFPKIIEKEFAGKKEIFDGILLDLGVSSHHFDSPERGFSFRFDGPLDMRMDRDNDEIDTAEIIVNSYSEERLEKIFREYGEENYSKRIAKKICEVREKAPITTTKELENLVFHCYPKESRHQKTNPSARVFQALRIEVNRELDVIAEVITQLFPLLKVGGRLLIISFHSLEDRIVKNEMKLLVDRGLESGMLAEILTKKPIVPGHEEILENSRSRSAKLRIIERVNEKKEKNKYVQFSLKKSQP